MSWLDFYKLALLVDELECLDTDREEYTPFAAVLACALILW